MEQRDKAMVAEMVQSKMGRMVVLWLTSIRDKMPPAAQNRHISPKPVALEREVRAHLGGFLGPETGEDRKDSSPIPHTLFSTLSQLSVQPWRIKLSTDAK